MMVAEVAHELERIGLGVGADTTHWTSPVPPVGGLPDLRGIDGEPQRWSRSGSGLQQRTG